MSHSAGSKKQPTQFLIDSFQLSLFLTRANSDSVFLNAFLKERQIVLLFETSSNSRTGQLLESTADCVLASWLDNVINVVKWKNKHFFLE